MTATRRCAFLTMADTSGWSIDAHLAIPPLAARGWSVESLPWREPGADWRRYDAVYLGTPWDYPEDVTRFLDVLGEIERAGPVIVNPVALVRWNIEKTYLRDLERQGAAIVPTEWHASLAEPDIDALGERSRDEPLVVKPVIGTNATDTYPLAGGLDGATRTALSRAFLARACMVQPFIEAIRDEGEYSLFYIGGGYSHAIHKVPKPGDFRVQEEHGARIDAVTPAASLRAAADAVLALVSPEPLYARADFVRGAGDRWLLMELELIEPSLYLRMDEGAPERFAAALDAYVSRLRAAG